MTGAIFANLIIMFKMFDKKVVVLSVLCAFAPIVFAETEYDRHIFAKVYDGRQV